MFRYIFLCLFLLLISAVYVSKNFLFNWSPSIPVGIYKRADKGNYIAFCAPEFIAKRKYAPYAPAQCGHRPLLLKPVVAGPGNTVVTEEKGVWVFGRKGRYYRAGYIGQDSVGQLMPRAKEVIKLKKGEWYVLSTYHPRAIDSRYLGTIKEKNVKGKYSPLITWP